MAGEHLHVVGWAACAGGVETIEVKLGSCRFMPGRSFPRPDIWRELPDLGESEIRGFALVIETRNFASGEYRLSLRASARATHEVAELTGTVRIGADEPYRAWLDSGGPSWIADHWTPPTGEPECIVLVLAGSGEHQRLDASLAAQAGVRMSRWTDAAGAALIEAATTGTPLVIVEASGTVAPGALRRLMGQLAGGRDSDLVYADEDALAADGLPGGAFFKPGWSPELLLSCDYVGPLVALAPEAAAAAAGALESEEPHTIQEILIGLAYQPLRAHRVPRVLFTSSRPRELRDQPAVHRAIERLARRRGRRCRVDPGGQTGLRDVRWPLERHPSVSLVVPSASPELLKRCLTSIRDHAGYPGLEVIVVDSSPGSLASVPDLFAGLEHRVVRYQGPFRVGEAINLGARQATGEVLVLLNDDTEVRQADWVQRMLEPLLTPGVGIVAPTLLFADGKIQHAGVGVGTGQRGCWHLCALFPGDAPGPHGILRAQRDCAAVTGACVMLTHSLFDALGGLDPAFASEFSDVDLCLRARARGLRVVVTPHAVLTHHERSSLPSQTNLEDARRFSRLWEPHYGDGDPYYHPAFANVSYEFSEPSDGACDLARLTPVDTIPSVEAGGRDGGDGPLPEFDAPPASLDAMTRAVAEGELVMWCETPSLDGSAVAEGFIGVRGWAYSPAGLTGVEVDVDGRRYRAGRGIFRSDVRRQFGPELTHTGFALRIELGEEQKGTLPVSVIARDSAGRATGMSGSIDCRPLPPAPGELEIVAEIQSAAELDGDWPSAPAVERYVPADVPGTPMEAEHRSRYLWASAAVAGREVLDAGCGVGYGTAMLARGGATRAVGIDISPEAITAAQREFGAQAGFLAADLHELPFEESSFDAIVCFEAIEHVTEPGRVLDEFRRVLRHEGVLIISTPNRHIYQPGNPFHVHEYTPTELEEALVRRFDEVRLYRQQTHFAAVIGAEDPPERADGELEVGGRVLRLGQAQSREELYTLALAGFVALPDLAPLTLIGGVADEPAWRTFSASSNERILVAEAERAVSAADAAEARRERERALELLAAAQPEHRQLEAALRDAQECCRQAQERAASMAQSRSWRLTMPLRALARRGRGRWGG